ncbi:MAG: methyl-accepting chemotaxis protein [Pseudomonadota bacterium]
MVLSNAKLGTKLYSGFGVVLGLMVIIAAIGITRLSAVNEEIDKIVNDANVKTSLANGMMNQMNVIARAIRNIVLSTDQSVENQEKQRIGEARIKFQEANEKLSKMVRSDRGKELLANIQVQQNAVKPITDKVMVLGLENKVEAATNVLMNELRIPQGKLLEALSGLINYQEEVTRKLAEGAAASYASARMLLIGISALAILSGLGISFFLTRGVTKSLYKVIDGLSEGAEQVIAASGEISSATQSLAEGSTEQAASIEETASSLEEISSMTRQNTQHAGQADILMKEAGQVVGQANNSMKELIRSMDEITRASEDTSKIVKSIDEIAFQTNLLALNAAVEAARAGEAGAGFAVVADEVRNLAMRAADAAKNTSDLIEMTVKKVKDGSGLVSKTNEAFVRMASTASNVAQLVSEIAAASKEQSQGIEQVNNAVAEMEKVVQQNAANAEENAAASEEMNAQAIQMQVFVEDLFAIVGSNGNGNGKKGLGDRMESWTKVPSAGVRTFAPVHSPVRSFQSSRKGKGNGTELVVSKRMKKRPGRLIPLDDMDEVSAEF